MKNAIGMLMYMFGLFLCFGAIGTLDVDPTASVVYQMFLAFLGLGIMLRSASYIDLSRTA